jgi:hypothetical protein
VLSLLDDSLKGDRPSLAQGAKETPKVPNGNEFNKSDRKSGKSVHFLDIISALELLPTSTRL